MATTAKIWTDNMIRFHIEKSEESGWLTVQVVDEGFINEFGVRGKLLATYEFPPKQAKLFAEIFS